VVAILQQWYSSFGISQRRLGRRAKRQIPTRVKRNPNRLLKKQESGRQTRRAAMRQAQHIQAHVSIGDSRATLDSDLRRSFLTVG